MGKIQILGEHMTNLIAAGEVIERAKSVVKELVENSIDAGATKIKIQLENGGLNEIRVTDNGSGMDPQDASMCFILHATSKIRNQNDLFNIRTLGFRGEALASIVAVSSFNLKTSTDGYHGVMMSLKGGVPLSEATISFPKGTEITVKNLFFNTPARLNHMKAPNVELAYITDFVSKIALAHKEVSFLLINNGKEVLHTSGSGNLLEVISEVYSTNVAKEMLEIFDNDGMFRINGYISKISVTKSSKNSIILCINGRVVYNKNIVNAIVDGYGSLLMNGKYPVAIVNIDVDLGMVDVNVHPTKYEVRLSDEEKLKSMLTSIISKTLSQTDLSVDVEYSADVKISDYEEEVDTSSIEKKLPFENMSLHESNNQKEDEEPEEDYVDEEQETDDYEEEADEYQEDNEYPEDNEDELEHLKDFIENYNVEEDNPTDEDIASLKEMDDLNSLLDKFATTDENIVTYQEEEKEDETPKEEQTKPIQEELSFLDEDKSLGSFEGTRLSKMYYIGQLFGTYIIAQNEESMFLIDQHAANERVNYEKIIREFKKPTQASYDLLVPITLEFSPSDKILVEENMEYINKFGIELDEFGANTFVVRSIPIWFFRGREQDFCEEIINNIIHSRKGQDYTAADFLNNIAATMACKKSIKANEYHSSLEIEYLLDELSKCENPFTCPHGRPVIVKVSKTDVEKWFKRIV